MKCAKCNRNEGLSGISFEIGGVLYEPVCESCLVDYAGLPTTEEEEKHACQGCRRRIKEEPLFLFNGFWHEKCFKDQVLRSGCPRCKSRSISKKGCMCGYNFKEVIAYAKQKAFDFYIQNSEKECDMCHKINDLSSLGVLPFHTRTPNRAERICSHCKGAFCSGHIDSLPKGNILEIDNRLPFCQGGIVGGCYEKLEEKIQCLSSDCETREKNFEGMNWNKFKDTKKCTSCGGFYCDYNHNDCPKCVGIECDGCENKIIDNHSAYYVQEGMSVHRVCEDCLSSMHCDRCGIMIADPGDETETGYCDYCLEEEDDYVRCNECNEVVPVEGASKYIEDVDQPLVEGIICETCSKEKYYDYCADCSAFHYKEYGH